MERGFERLRVGASGLSSAFAEVPSKESPLLASPPKLAWPEILRKVPGRVSGAGGAANNQKQGFRAGGRGDLAGM